MRRRRWDVSMTSHNNVWHKTRLMWLPTTTKTMTSFTLRRWRRRRRAREPKKQLLLWTVFIHPHKFVLHINKAPFAFPTTQCRISLEWRGRAGHVFIPQNTPDSRIRIEEKNQKRWTDFLAANGLLISENQGPRRWRKGAVTSAVRHSFSAGCSFELLNIFL